MQDFIERYEDYGIYGIDYTRAGQQYAICPNCSHTRQPQHQNLKCLGVNVDKGIWHCNHCDWSGYLKKERKPFERPVFRSIKKDYREPGKNSYAWFESRGISREIVDRNRITKDKIYMPEAKKEVTAICFNYYVGDELVNVKYRDNEKHFCQEKNAQKIFYKLNDIEDASDCIITEGEMDALSFEAAGYKNAISVPDGAINPNAKNITVKLQYLDNCADYFEDMKKIYLATDIDAPGIRLREELARRLGKVRCWIVKYPEDCKDANDVLMKHGKTALVNCITAAEPYPVEGVHYAKSRAAELRDLYENGYPNGARTGWEKFDEKVRFYDSCLSIITGIPSHGKSNFVDHLMLRLSLMNGWKFGIFSPENSRIEIHLHRLCEIITGKQLLPGYRGRMSPEERDKAMDFINDNIFFILPRDEDYTLQNILDAAEYLVLKHGIKALIIDPWNCVEHEYGTDSETEYTKKALNKLLYFERNHGLHLFIVAHPAKMRKLKDSGKYDIPTLYDISGSAHWYNKAEIGITIWREFDKDINKTVYTAAYIQKVKHQFMGTPGMIKFDFDPRCQRFYEKESERREKSYLDGHVPLSREGYPESFDEVSNDELDDDKW